MEELRFISPVIKYESGLYTVFAKNFRGKKTSIIAVGLFGPLFEVNEISLINENIYQLKLKILSNSSKIINENILNYIDSDIYYIKSQLGEKI